MNAEQIYEVLMSQSFNDWYKDTLEKYAVGNSEHTKEEMLEDIKYFFNLEK
jgi:hypothetical protein